MKLSGNGVVGGNDDDPLSTYQMDADGRVLNERDALRRIRFTSSQEKYMMDRILEAE